MLERQERAAMVLLLGVVITVITAHLLLGSFGKQPFARPFTNDSPDGELVIADGYDRSDCNHSKRGAHECLY